MKKTQTSKPPRKPKAKHPLAMSSEELEKFVDQVRRSPTRPLTAKDRAFVARVKGATSVKHIYLDENTAVRAIDGYVPERGRPRVGLGAKQVLISMERGFLSRVDGYAKEHRMNRSQLIMFALAQVMNKAG